LAISDSKVLLTRQILFIKPLHQSIKK